MKKKFILSLLFLNYIAVYSFASQKLWQNIPNNDVTSKGERLIVPNDFSSFYLNSGLLKAALFSLGNDISKGGQFDLPSPDGTFRTYMIWQTPVMQDALAAKYPEIKTFTGYAIDDRSATIKLDFTYKGFHAKVFAAGKTYFIDPYSNGDDGFYICYYKKNYPRSAANYMTCEVGDEEERLRNDAMDIDPRLPELAHKTNGVTRKEYRLALACTVEYSQAVDGLTPAKPNVLSAMVTSINRVNGVYERELAVTMTLIAKNDTLIYLTGTDPYSNGNGGAMLGENQTNIDNVIGDTNYDMGHVFSTGGGGVAFLGCVCDNGVKARGVTGSSTPLGDPFDIDYVAHEMGHQFGSDHTFNANTGGCSGNGVSSMAYEPGGGTTIMAYAGICGSVDNLQNNSDDYFHAASLNKISSYITTGDGATCPLTTPIANIPPSIPPFTQSYSIPFLTPFELTAPVVTDNDHDVLNYCWEQWNRGDFKSSWSAANLKGPIFRSFEPDLSPTRVFTTPAQLVNNVTAYKGEKLPQGVRFLTFKLTVRDIIGTLGTFNFPDDTIHLDVINTSTPFEVTFPNVAVSWLGATSEIVTWNVSGTDIAPINASNVDIYLSTDGGFTYPVLLLANTANDGSESIAVPNNINTTTARIKVKAVGNVFFDISDNDFTIAKDLNSLTELNKQNNILVYPIPAKDLLTIQTGINNDLTVVIFNTVGQRIWNAKLNKVQTISVANWAKGIYYAQFTSNKTSENVVKKFIVE